MYKMIKGGLGGGHTRTGLVFEERVALKAAFEKLNFKVESGIVYLGKKPVAQLLQKHNLYRNLLEKNNINYKDIISKKLLPDEAVFVEKNKTLYIIEMKFQHIAGSVDEKLQTCDFKNKQYKKLVKKLGFKVKYIYILSDWFKQKQYEDVLNYIKDVGSYYFFEELPLEFLDL